MFDTLSGRLRTVFADLTRRGALRESDIDEALREIRRALIDADVALDVVRDLVGRVRTTAVEAEVLSSVSPGQQVVKLVHDALVNALGGDDGPGALRIDSPPAVVLLVGLQGSGKTTSAAKLAHHLTVRERKKILLASLDTRRPAAMEQLELLGERAGVHTLPIQPQQDAVAIARRARDEAARRGHDVVILDTAGRMAVDDELMNEALAVRDATGPRETLLVADSLTGQDAVRVAAGFHGSLGLTGVILTRLDGDGRGGAALSMRAVTGQPIRFSGTGEGIEDLEVFHPDRLASRILGQGDVVTLVEKAQATVAEDDSERLARRMAKGRFDLNDLRRQLEGVEKMGGATGLIAMLPGAAAARERLGQAAAANAPVRRQIAIICSMTRQERRQPGLLQASRKRRVAAGAGVPVQEVNRLLKAHRNVHDMIRRASRAGGTAGDGPDPAAAVARMLGGGGGPAGMMARHGSGRSRRKRR